jgi:hypothetical protein
MPSAILDQLKLHTRDQNKKMVLDYFNNTQKAGHYPLKTKSDVLCSNVIGMDPTLNPDDPATKQHSEDTGIKFALQPLHVAYAHFLVRTLTSHCRTHTLSLTLAARCTHTHTHTHCRTLRARLSCAHLVCVLCSLSLSLSARAEHV